MGHIVRETGSRVSGNFCDINYVSCITKIYKVNCFGKKKLLFSYYKHLSSIIIDGKEKHKMTIRRLK